MDAISKKVTEFFASYPERRFDTRELIARPGEDLPGVMYIIGGRVSQYDVTDTGNEVVVNAFKPGAFFPMSAAINNTPNEYFYEASLPTVVRIAPAAEVVEFLRQEPAVLFDLLSRVYRGVDGILRRMAHLMGGNARTRLVFELLNAAQRFGEFRPDGSVRIALKEGDIARHSGLARETVNRLIQNLKAEELIRVTTKGLVIPDAKRLEATLHNDR